MKLSTAVTCFGLLLGASSGAAGAQELLLRSFEGKGMVKALTSGELVSPKRSTVHVLGFARASDNSIELSSDCRTWTEYPLQDVNELTETLRGSGQCQGTELAFVRLTLKTGATVRGSDNLITYSMRRTGSRRIGIPGLLGGGLAVSDTVWEACVNQYLACQIEECAGKGEWCLKMCDYEFDWCVRSR